MTRNMTMMSRLAILVAMMLTVGVLIRRPSPATWWLQRRRLHHQGDVNMEKR